MCHPLPNALFASSLLSRLHSLSGSQNRSYQYDAAGNTLSDGLRSYSYDTSNRLSQIVSGSVTETRHYNGLGQRVKRTVTQNGQSVSTHYVYDEAGQLLGEYSGDGTLINEIVYLNDLPVLLLTPDSVHAIHADHLNTPRAIVNSAGTVLWKWDSAPYGDTPAHEDPDGNGVALKFNPRFPGQLYDQETGLHYNYFRDYDPVTGRYIESDPIGLEGGVNTYGYVQANPLSGKDPLGLCTYAWDDFIGMYCKEEFDPDYVPQPPRPALTINCFTMCMAKDAAQDTVRDFVAYHGIKIMVGYVLAPEYAIPASLILAHGRKSYGGAYKLAEMGLDIEECRKECEGKNGGCK